MFFLFQLTSSLLYDIVFVIVVTFGLVALFGSLATHERKKHIRKLPKVEVLIALSDGRTWPSAEEEGFKVKMMPLSSRNEASNFQAWPSHWPSLSTSPPKLFGIIENRVTFFPT
jgi:hypothetical protein